MVFLYLSPDCFVFYLGVMDEINHIGITYVQPSFFMT